MWEISGIKLDFKFKGKKGFPVEKIRLINYLTMR